MDCNWLYFPNTQRPPARMMSIVEVFSNHLDEIASPQNRLTSNDVLAMVASDLESAGFLVERGKKKSELLEMPVLFKEQGKIEKAFWADAFNPDEGIVVEVEAGRATVNYQFLKDFFEASMMLDANYLCIAVRNIYESSGTQSKDFEKVVTFFKTLYASGRITTPLKGIMIIGY